MRTSIGEIDPDLPDTLLGEYDCSFVSEQLCGLLLSKNGIETRMSDKWSLAVWDDCDGYINRMHADAKVCDIEWIFHWRDPSNIAGVKFTRAFSCATCKRDCFYPSDAGWQHRCIRTHSMAFDSNPSPPVCLLPRPLSGSTAYRVVIAGEMTDAQEAKVRKMQRIRHEKVRKALAFYKKYNILYSEIEVDEDYFQQSEDELGDMNNGVLIFASDADGVEVDG